MSYSGTANLFPAAEVESFVYQSTGGLEPASTATGESGNDPQGKNEAGPRGSEQDMSRLVSEARTAGMREGEKQARAQMDQELAQQRKQIANAIASFEQERSEYYSKVEVELVQFALSIAARILHREAQVDRMLVAGLVKVMLEKLEEGTKVKARVRPEEASSWRHYFQDNENLEVVEDASLAPKDCKLETQMGIAEMGLESQLKEIEKGFFDLLAQRPQPK